MTKLIASRLARSNRNKFSTTVHDIKQLLRMAKRVANNQTVAMKLVSFSSSRDYPEQILSILSFLRNVGTPVSWTIYSDGSHTEREAEIAESVFPFVTLIKDDPIDNNSKVKPILIPYERELRHFAENHVLGKKLFCYLNHMIDGPTLFLDSDILFYEKAVILKSLPYEKAPGWYIADCSWGCLDRRYLVDKAPEHYQVNTGVFLMNAELLDVQDGLSFLRTTQNVYEYFTEQTIMHILLTSNKHKPLDPDLFIVNTSDQFDFSYTYSPHKIAIRHYTGPVRHKMWQRDWKWQLSLT